MLTPRYLFAGDFQAFHDYFCEQPHLRKRFAKGSCLWRPGQPCEAIHYILSGMAMNYADHESGRRKIISFHGAGTVFPGYHQTDYRIELSLVTTALTDMEVLEFTTPPVPGHVRIQHRFERAGGQLVCDVCEPPSVRNRPPGI